MKRLFPISLAICCLSIAVFAQKENTASAQHILTQMFSAYESCSSYLDEGQVETIVITKARTWTDTKPFRTAFVRHANFFFECKHRQNNQSNWMTYIVWEDNLGIQQWWTPSAKIQTFDKLGFALAGAAAVSSLSAYNVPFLLKGDLKRQGHRFQRVSEFQVIGEESVNGKAAYKLAGNDRHTMMKEQIQPLTIWIAKDGFLLLKIFQKLTIQNGKTGEDFEAETTTTYQPQINVEIPQDKFKVIIPAG
jgi:hypothetical protein